MQDEGLLVLESRWGSGAPDEGLDLVPAHLKRSSSADFVLPGEGPVFIFTMGIKTENRIALGRANVSLTGECSR